MTDEETFRRWAGDILLDAAKFVYTDSLYLAKTELADAMRWIDRAIEAQNRREAAEVLAAYTDLADVA